MKALLDIGTLRLSIPAMSQPIVDGLTEALPKLLQGFKGGCTALFVGEAIDILLEELTWEHDLENLRAVVAKRWELLKRFDVTLLD